MQTLSNVNVFILAFILLLVNNQKESGRLAISDGVGFSHTGGAIAGEAKADSLGLQTAENLARNMASMLRRQADVG